MSSPNFSLSLDEFPDLLNVYAHHQGYLGESLVMALRREVELNGETSILSWYSLQKIFGKLRKSFLSAGDEKSAIALADLILAVEPDDDYAQHLLSDWQTETKDAEIVRAILRQVTQSRNLPAYYANTLKFVSDFCHRSGMEEVARPLFMAWRELPPPRYPELDWLPLPIRQIGSRIDPLPTPLHPLTTPPEGMDDAHNGWRKGKWNPITSQQEVLVRPIFEQEGLQLWADTIVAKSQNCIRFEPKEHQANAVGIRRFGGLPDVPEGWIWPENMEFLAQFNLEELAPFDVNHALPLQGALRIFVGREFDAWKVEWEEGDIEHLKRGIWPADYSIRGLDTSGSDLTVYSPVPVAPCRVVSLPSSYMLSQLYENDEHLFNHVGPLGELDTVADMLLPSHVFGWNHQLLGNYDDGSYPQDEENVLLFQIDSNDDMGTMFSDAGTVYFLIRREDLVARRFDRVFVTMTCG